MTVAEKIAPAFNTSDEHFPSPFCKLRIDISESILKNLIPVMNEIHGVNFSYRFWKLILSDYINAVISIRHVLEEKLLTTAPGLEAVNSHHVPTRSQKLIRRAPSVIKHYKQIGAVSKTEQLIRQHNNLSFGLPPLDAVKADTGQPLPVLFSIYPGSGNRKKRAIANHIASKQASMLMRNVISQLPQLFVEYFEKEFNRVSLINPDDKIFHLHGFPPYSSIMIVAKYAEHGAKIFCYQHGAYYGEFEYHNAWFHESSIADEFRTWGWKISENNVPWKAYRLEKFRQKYVQFDSANNYDLIICFTNLHGVNAGFYKKATNFFLDNLDKGKYKSILGRPRPENKIFSHASQISFIKDSRVKIDTGLTDMAEMMRQSQLVVHVTLPATNFLECIYVDHPVTGVLDNDQPTGVVKPYYDFFLANGVMHDSFNSLVEHLNTVDVPTWWANIISDPVYKQFKNEFARQVQSI